MNNFEKNRNFYEENQDNNDIASKNAKKKNSSSNKKGRGFFGFFAYLADCLAKGIQNSFLGFLFADLYTNLNNKWRNGKIYQLFHRKKNQVRAKARFANLYETSIIRSFISRLASFLIQTYLRTFGIAIFAFAFSTIFMGMLKYSIYIMTDVDVDVQSVGIVGIVTALFSLPLIVSKRKVGEALLNGRLSKFIVHQILSIDETILEPNESVSGGSYLVAFEIGMFLGFATYFIEPLIVIGLIVVFLSFALIMCFPELGIMSIMVVIPFVSVFENPSLILLFLVLFTTVAFISKFVRGKRIMRFELVDLGVLLFGALTLFGGIFTKGGISSLFSAIMYFGFLCIYFLIVNSYIRKTWIYRGIKLMVVLTSLVAIAGILDGGEVSASIVDMEKFGSISARANAFFGNPNMLGAYLVIVFPFALAQTKSTKNGLIKALYSIGALAMAGCIVLTWSRGAWLGLIVALVVYLLVSDFRSIWLVILGGASFVPAVIYLAPQTVSERLISTVTMADSSIQYRLNIWEGVLDMIGDYFWTGIGVGENAFKNVYSGYAVSGTETVMHSHSLFLQIIVELGIIGLAVFLLVMLMFSQKCFAGVKERRRGSKSRLMISAGYASVCGALVAGITDHIFYNYRVFLVFWIFVGLTVALTKINEKEKSKVSEARKVNSSSRSADLDIFIE